MSRIEIIKQPHNDFIVSLCSQGKDKDFIFFINLVHTHSNQSYVIEVKEPVQVEGRYGSIFMLSPLNLKENILNLHLKCMQVTKDAEVVLILEIAGERVSFPLPAPKKEESRNIGTEVRFKNLQQRLLERIDQLNQRCVKTQQYYEKVEERFKVMDLQLQKVKGKAVKTNEMPEDKDLIDPQTLQILNGLTLQSQNSSIDALKADMEKQINQLSQRNNWVSEEMKVQIGRMYEELNIKIENHNVGMERYDNYLLKIEKQIVSSVINIANSLYISDACSASMIIKRQGVHLSNKYTQQSYNYFFSKYIFPKQSVTTLALQTKKEEILFGFCDRSCLQSEQIFRQKAAFFFTFEKNMYIAGERLPKQSSSVDEEIKTVIMTVDLKTWTVSWKVEGIKDIYVGQIPAQLMGAEFHPTVLMNHLEEEVVLSFA